MQNRIKLMVIDGSAVCHSWLIESLEKNPRFEIMGYAVSAFDARDKISVLKPGVLALGIEMPGMSGLDFLKKYLPSYPIPVALVSSLNARISDTLTARAMDFVRKPDMDSHTLKEVFLSMLMAKLTTAAASRVRIPPVTPASLPSVKMPALRTSLSMKPAACQDMVIAIGASAGGIEAILEVLRRFPENMPGVIITQHIPVGFTAICAERLSHLYRMEMREAKSGDKPRPGLVLLAPGGLQTRVVHIGNGYAANYVRGERVNGHCPSMNVLFDTISGVVRDKAMGVLLADVGADGVAGLLQMRKNGAYAIGQDQDTCIVYGMPTEAYKIGAVCQRSPLSSIPQPVINKLTQF